MSRVWDRVGAATGAVAVVLAVIGGFLGDPYRSGFSPDPTDPSSSIARALIEVRGDARKGAFLGLISAFLLLWFVSYLRSHLARHEAGDAWMSGVAHAGGTVAVALLLVSNGITLGATELTSYGADEVVAKVFLTLGWNYFYIVSPPLMALVAASAVVTLRFDGLPRWLAVLGLIMLLVPFIVGAGTGAIVGLLWIFLASLVLMVSSFRRATSASAAPI